MTDIAKIKFYLKELENGIEQIKDTTIKTNLENALKLAKSQPDDQLAAVMIMPSIKDAMSRMYDNSSFATTYSEMGITLPAAPTPAAPGANTPVATDPNNPLANFGMNGAGAGAIGGILWALVSTPGGLPQKIGAAIKFAMVGGAGGAALGNMDEIQKMAEPLLKAFGPLGDKILDIFKSATTGSGNIVEQVTDVLGDLAEDPKKLLAIAVAAIAAVFGFNKGNGLFGGMFKAGEYIMKGLLALWVAPTLLNAIGIDVDKALGPKIEYDVEPRRPDQLTQLPADTGMTVAALPS